MRVNRSSSFEKSYRFENVGVNRKISDRVRCGMILTGSPGGPRHGKKGTDGA